MEYIGSGENGLDTNGKREGFDHEFDRESGKHL